MIAGVFLVSIDFSHVKTAKHLKRIIFQRIFAKVGAVIYEYYKNAFDERYEKEIFKACEFDSCQVKLTKIKRTRLKAHLFGTFAFIVVAIRVYGCLLCARNCTKIRALRLEQI